MAEQIKKMATTTKVNLKINFSTPRLVNEEEFVLLENPVPLTCNKTKIIKSTALIA